MTAPKILKIPVGQGNAVYAKPAGGPCQVHDWPTEGMGPRLLAAMRERHGKGGVDVCWPCLERARTRPHHVSQATAAPRVEQVTEAEAIFAMWAINGGEGERSYMAELGLWGMVERGELTEAEARFWIPVPHWEVA